MAKGGVGGGDSKSSIGVSSIDVGNGLPLLLASAGDRDVGSVDTGGRLQANSIGVGSIGSNSVGVGTQVERISLSLSLLLAQVARYRDISSIHTGGRLEAHSIRVASIAIGSYSSCIGVSSEEQGVSISHSGSHKGRDNNKELHDDDAALICL